MLKGKVIITTQPADQAEEMLMLLDAKGAKAYNLPMIETQTIKIPEKELHQLLQPGRFDLLVFTSKKGVRGFFGNLSDLQGDFHLPPELKIAVVGHATGAELEKYGYEPAFVNPGTDAKDLADFLSENISKTGNNILLALSNKAPDFLETTLSEIAGVVRIDVYETIPLSTVDEELANLVKNRKTDMCIFTSPSGFYAFLDVFHDANSIQLSAIGNTTANAIKECGYDVAVTAPNP
ncbi:MAG: uroporphyrinogen-III synthase, partial [Bacteroidales bacterium]